MPPLGHMDWIGFGKLDPRPTLALYAIARPSVRHTGGSVKDG